MSNDYCLWSCLYNFCLLIPLFTLLCVCVFYSFVVFKGGGCSSLKYNISRFQTYQQVRQSFTDLRCFCIPPLSVPFSCIFSELLWMLVLNVFKERLDSFNPSGDSYRRPVAFLMCHCCNEEKSSSPAGPHHLCCWWFFTGLFCSLLGPAVSLDSTLESRRDEHTQNNTQTAKSSANQSTIRVVIYSVLFWSNLVCAGPV